MKKYTQLMTAVGVVTLLAACAGESTATTNGGGGTVTTGAADGPTFIYITPNPIGINKFLELGQIGTQRAAEATGGSFKVFESTDLNSRRANVEAAIEEAPDVIVLTTFEFTEMAAEFAPAIPEQEFILIDACPESESPIENLHCGVFREHEGAYLLGLMAGNLTESGQIGSVVALDIPFLHRWSDSFALGAQTIDPSITDSQVFIAGDNPFSDPATAKEQALALAAQGADQIFAVGAGSNGGIFEAAVEEGFMTYGVDVNQCPDAPGSIVDNNLKLVDIVVEQLINSILDGSAEPLTSFGLAEGGTGVVAISDELADSECLIADFPEIVSQVQTAADQIIDGSLEVPDPLFG
ncbi:MAG: BMP family ABC transporter substrate-binding protein [Acidimicrobiia bacterium]